MKKHRSGRGRIWKAAIAAVPLFSIALAGMAAPISGGSFAIVSSAILTGGVRSSGGSMVNSSAIGGYGTSISGGIYTVTPGVVPSITPAQPDATKTHVYPTSYIPSEGHDHLTFAELPARATIRIYSISGKLVKTLDKNDSSDLLAWRPANEQGSNLTSGVYTYVITPASGSSKSGKFVVIK